MSTKLKFSEVNIVYYNNTHKYKIINRYIKR